MPVKLTIGTAVYNVGEDLLRAHIDSIIGQLCDETELLLIDDCSTDNCGEICKEYAQKSSHIRYINMGVNQGLSCVRNKTIDEAQGKWIFFADGDDLISEHFVETALSFYDADYDIIIHDRGIICNEKVKKQAPCTIKELTKSPENIGRELSLSVLCLKPFDPTDYGMHYDVFYHAAWGALYRKEFLWDNDLKFPKGQKKAQDSVFNTYAYFDAKKIAYLPYIMYYYRKNMQGITKRYSADFIEITKSLMRHHYDCIKKLYANDPKVCALYENYRAASLTIDSMRLNYFHKDNPNPRKVRKKDFINFANSEPFKRVIEDFDLGSCDWYRWRLPMLLAKKRDFAILDLAFKHEIIFSLYGKISGNIRKFRHC